MLTTRDMVGLIVVVGIVAACGGGDGDGGGGGGPSQSIAKAGAPNGDAQTAVVATALPESLRVIVQEDGAPLAGATVTWTAQGTGATVAPLSAVTDAAGRAATSWTLGQTAGAQTARATLSGASGSPLTFTATATAGAATALTKTSGDAQSANPSGPFDDPLEVKVADAFGNGVVGVTVDWTVISGGVTLTGGATSVTNAQGIATKAVAATATLGAAVVQASTAAVAATQVNFNLTVELQPVPVAIGDIFFRSVGNGSQDPAVDTTTIGRAVRWANTGSATHTVRSQDAPSFASSGNLVGNGSSSYTVTFPAAGTYQYDCAIHGPDMTGRIVVLP